MNESRIRAFADELFDAGEYFRAATEYMRVIAYGDLTGSEAENLRYRIANCSYKASRFKEAGRLFGRLAAETESSELRGDCLLLLAASRMRSQDYAGSLAAAQTAETGTLSPPYRSRFAYIKGLSLLHLDRPREAGEAFSAVPESDPLRPSAVRLSGIARRAENLPDIRPFTTGMLSALVPGLGQMVCGYFWDGLTAMVITGASLAIGITGDRRDNDALATTGYALFGLWHAGNIYGGVNAARRAGRQAKERLLSAARAQNALSFD